MNRDCDYRYSVSVKVKSTGILIDLEPGEFIGWCACLDEATEMAKKMSQWPNAVGRARILDLQPDPRVVRW